MAIQTIDKCLPVFLDNSGIADTLLHPIALMENFDICHFDTVLLTQDNLCMSFDETDKQLLSCKDG